MGDASGDGGAENASSFDEAAAGEFDVGERGLFFRKSVFELVFDIGAALGAHGRASRGLMVRDGYRTTSQHTLTKRPRKKMHAKKSIFADDLKVMMLAFTQASPKFNKAVGRVICVSLLFSSLQ